MAIYYYDCWNYKSAVLSHIANIPSNTMNETVSTDGGTKVHKQEYKLVMI